MCSQLTTFQPTKYRSKYSLPGDTHLIDAVKILEIQMRIFKSSDQYPDPDPDPLNNQIYESKCEALFIHCLLLLCSVQQIPSFRYRGRSSTVGDNGLTCKIIGK